MLLFSGIIVLDALFSLNLISFFDNELWMVYSVGILVSMIILAGLIFGNKDLANYKKWAILFSAVLLLVIITIQFKYDSICIISSGICLVTLFQYFTVESPDLKYIDELNGLKVKAEQANGNLFALIWNEYRGRICQYADITAIIKHDVARLGIYLLIICRQRETQRTPDFKTAAGVQRHRDGGLLQSCH